MAKRILVPVDQTPVSTAVVELAGDLARSAGATVRLLHVAPVPDNVLNDEGHVVAYADQEVARLEAEGLDFLRSVDASLGGVPVEYRVRFGEPATEIMLEADAFEADLIAMAMRCRGKLARLVMGSVTEQVCRRSEIPVVVYRPLA